MWRGKRAEMHALRFCPARTRNVCTYVRTYMYDRTVMGRGKTRIREFRYGAVCCHMCICIRGSLRVARAARISRLLRDAPTRCLRWRGSRRYTTRRGVHAARPPSLFLPDRAALFITTAAGAQAATLCRRGRSQPESRYSRPDIILLYLRSERGG